MGKILKAILKVIVYIVLAIVAVILITRLVVYVQIRNDRDKGIQENEYIEINGIRQFIQIRGNDKKNPIVLFIHGGPGSPHAFISHYYQKDLEDYFTFVNWDQRDCGRTYFANDGNEAANMELMYEDLELIVDNILEKFGQDKLIIMGHSWGSIIGSQYAQDHPDKTLHYVGIGQVWTFKEGEELATAEAVKRAEDDGRQEDAKKIQEAFDKVQESVRANKLDMEALLGYRGLTTGKELVSPNVMPMYKSMWLGITSPNMNIDDIRWFLKLAGDNKLYISLYHQVFSDALNFDLKRMHFSVPVTIIMGKDDWTTPMILSEKYIGDLDAPNKELYIIDKAGHAPYLDQREEFSRLVLKSLVNYK